MGKDLHYSIRPFIERALLNHSAVKSVVDIQTEEFYAYKIERNFGMSSLTLVLSDEYYFGASKLASKPSLLKDGGYYLIARPEASNFECNYIDSKLSIGKIGKLLGALNQEEFWLYEPLTEDEKRKRKEKNR